MKTNINFWRNDAATADHLELKLSEGRICHLGWLIVGHHCWLCVPLSFQPGSPAKSAVQQCKVCSVLGRIQLWWAATKMSLSFCRAEQKGLWAVLLQIALPLTSPTCNGNLNLSSFEWNGDIPVEMGTQNASAKPMQVFEYLTRN